MLENQKRALSDGRAFLDPLRVVADDALVIYLNFLLQKMNFKIVRVVAEIGIKTQEIEFEIKKR